MYIAIIADMIGSRTLDARHDIQLRLVETLNQVNRDYEDQIASNFTITLGDEFQGLLLNASKLLEIIEKIKAAMHPVDLRFGIGIGEISTEINRMQSIGADGPAYWFARSAIDHLKKENDYDVSRSQLQLSSKEDWVEVVNDSLKLCDYVESKWVKSQREFIDLSIMNYGFNLDFKQIEIAETFGMSVQMVNKKLQNTGYYQYIRLKQSINDLVQNKMVNIDG
ncbi:MAG: SatD family protein [Erysipelotrichaceae bacterium]